jgi:hypothetical protein
MEGIGIRKALLSLSGHTEDNDSNAVTDARKRLHDECYPGE